MNAAEMLKIENIFAYCAEKTEIPSTKAEIKGRICIRSGQFKGGL